MNLFDLFPTGVAFFNLDRELTEIERTYLTTLEQGPNEGNTTSVFKTVLENEKVLDLRIFIEQCLAKYFAEIYQPIFDVKLRITQSWTNHSDKGRFHHKHPHPNSFVSGCFYINADKEQDKIFFFNEIYRHIEIPTKHYNQYNSKSWWLPVGTGDLILFPSYLTHMVEPVKAEETRISLAFNTFPIGQVGDDANLTGLYL